jgi:putative ABC transport system substrate-binding protein
MKRREFIAGLGAVAWPLVGRAQQGDRVRRVGVLLPGDEVDPLWKPRLSAFTQALADLGWTDGRNMRIDLRWGGDDNNRIRARLGSPLFEHTAAKAPSDRSVKTAATNSEFVI